MVECNLTLKPDNRFRSGAVGRGVEDGPEVPCRLDMICDCLALEDLWDSEVTLTSFFGHSCCHSLRHIHFEVAKE